MKSLIQVFEETIENWRLNPPILTRNEWIKGKEGELYIRWNKKWTNWI